MRYLTGPTNFDHAAVKLESVVASSLDHCNDLPLHRWGAQPGRVDLRRPVEVSELDKGPAERGREGRVPSNRRLFRPEPQHAERAALSIVPHLDASAQTVPEEDRESVVAPSSRGRRLVDLPNVLKVEEVRGATLARGSLKRG